jgi:hypothetical protein
MTTTTEVRERPILFSGEMVRAILEGRKTQTRRVVKPQPPGWIDRFGHTAFTPLGSISGRGWWPDAESGEGVLSEKFFKSPYGRPGDRLWVRESIALVSNHYEPSHGGAWGRDYAASVYQADGELTLADAWPWKRHVLPSIHMPRGLSRITLEVTDVRVERLQEISGEDAKAEGLSWVAPTYGVPGVSQSWHADPIESFRALWDSINDKGLGWDANPWVWVVSFRRVPA